MGQWKSWPGIVVLQINQNKKNFCRNFFCSSKKKFYPNDKRLESNAQALIAIWLVDNGNVQNLWIIDELKFLL